MQYVVVVKTRKINLHHHHHRDYNDYYKTTERTNRAVNAIRVFEIIKSQSIENSPDLFPIKSNHTFVQFTLHTIVVFDF